MTVLADKFASLANSSALVAGLLLLFVPIAMCQMTSANYQLSHHNLAGGGGIGSSGTQAVVGTIPISGAGLTWADNWASYNGLISAALGRNGKLLAYYTNRLVDTVDFSGKLLKVSYGGGAGEVSGGMFVRPGGSPWFEQRPMVPAAGDTLMFDVNEDQLSIRGLEFYFRIDRGEDTVMLADADSPYVWVTHFTNEQGQRPDPTREGSYRMVGLPVNIEGPHDVAAVFEDDLGEADPSLWRLGSHEIRGDSVIEFPNASPATPARGYWLITRYKSTYGAAGHTVLPTIEHAGTKYYPIRVRPGWNQIANPFPFNINWLNVLYEIDNIIRPHDSSTNVFWYAGAGYATPIVMTAWQGYFFFTMESNMRLLIPYVEWTLPNPKASLERIVPDDTKFDWSLEFSLTSEGNRSESAVLAVYAMADTALDESDQPMPPSPPGFPRLGFRVGGGDPWLWQVDARPPVDSLTVWELDLSRQMDRQLTVMGTDRLPENTTATLILDIGSSFSLDNDRTIALPDDSRRARVVVGRPAWVEAETGTTLPENYELHQNFPNPFNPRTSIRFALPVTGDVKLRIFNLLGQEVTTLINEPMPAGVHTVVWDGQLNNGHTAASGVYFYQLISGSFHATQKMVLVK